MAFKFLHSSDWHLGASRRLTPNSTEYLERHVKAIKEVLKIAMKEKVDFLLISGDLFENSQTTIPELIAAHDIFTTAGEIAPTVATAGNHDELQVGEFQTHWLRLLNIPNVEFICKPQGVTIGHQGGPSHVAAVPWTGIKRQEEFDQYLETHIRSVGEVEIAMLHECFAGVTLDSGLVSKGGVLVPHIPGVRYYALGDIHKMQRVRVQGSAINGSAYYSGAPLQYNFGDVLPKGCMIVEVSDDRIYTPVFVEIPQAIELHNITSLDQIPADSPHWYKLKIDAANMPRHVPANVKVVEPIPRHVEMPQPVVSEDGKVLAGCPAVDFSDGVAQLLGENGFSPEEIASSIEEVKQQAARA